MLTCHTRSTMWIGAVVGAIEPSFSLLRSDHLYFIESCRIMTGSFWRMFMDSSHGRHLWKANWPRCQEEIMGMI
jgi:hypothetical protein